jgi:hypothetical protein
VSQITSANSGRKASCDQTCLPIVFATPGWDTMAITTRCEGGQSMRAIEESTERRKAVRYGVEARVNFNWGNLAGGELPFRGYNAGHQLGGCVHSGRHLPTCRLHAGDGGRSSVAGRYLAVCNQIVDDGFCAWNMILQARDQLALPRSAESSLCRTSRSIPIAHPWRHQRTSRCVLMLPTSESPKRSHRGSHICCVGLCPRFTVSFSSSALDLPPV